MQLNSIVRRLVGMSVQVNDIYKVTMHIMYAKYMSAVDMVSSTAGTQAVRGAFQLFQSVYQCCCERMPTTVAISCRQPLLASKARRSTAVEKQLVVLVIRSCQCRRLPKHMAPW
jgi:hypothetical protein